MAISREHEVPVLLIKDPCSIQGLHAAWGIGNNLLVFSGKNKTYANRDPVAMQFSPKIYEINWDTEMHSRINRRLVNESHNIFITLQQQMAESASKANLLNVSRQYRATLKACSMALQAEAESTIDEKQKVSNDNQLQIFTVIELIWNLCEIMFIDKSPTGVVLGQLREWIQCHFTKGSYLAEEILMEERPDVHPGYWEAIYRLVLQGRVDDGRQMLLLHSNRHLDSFRSMEGIMKRMPQFVQSAQGFSLADFEMKWHHWQAECRSRLDSGDFSANEYLQTLAKILCGQETVFYELRDFCETWYHMLMSKLLYTKPTIKNVDLHEYIQECICVFSDERQLGHLDNILRAALEYDIHQVIQDSSSYFSSWWFTAHLTDLLHHTGQSGFDKLHYGSNYREYLILEYATSLMSHKSLWQVGVHYYDHCPEFGRSQLEVYIERIPLDTERKALKLLKICEEREMHEQAKSICKMMGKKCLQNSRVGVALMWYVRSKDISFVSLLSDRLLAEYSEKGCFSNLDLLENLGSVMFLSNKLAFLGKYREFHKLYEDGEIHEAANLLLSLISARLAPKQFWVTLLYDALPLLEAETIVLSSWQTYELMHCLQELTEDRNLIRDSQQKNTMELEEMKLNYLRLALTRNLARAIIQEGSVKPS